MVSSATLCAGDGSDGAERQRKRAGVLYMLASAVAFSLMSLFVKVIGETLPSTEIVVFRGLLTTLVSAWMVRRAGVPWLGASPKYLAARGVFGSVSLLCIFYTTTRLPLADAIVLQYLHPAFSACLAPWLIGEKSPPVVWLAMVLALAGVVAVSFSHGNTLLLTGLASQQGTAIAVSVCGALFTSLAYMTVRKLSGREHPSVIVFYFSCFSLMIALPLALPHFVCPQGWQWLALLAVGVCTQFGQLWLTQGITRLPVGPAAVYSHAQVPLAALWAWICFGQAPTLAWGLGALLIVGASLLLVWRRPSTPAKYPDRQG